jgi:glycerophosphoryl diester phosphodiesterase
VTSPVPRGRGHPFFAGAPLLIAHRGGRALAPENTLRAFTEAVERWGADMLEIDVHATADGEVAVIHDETVDRTTDGTGRVDALTLASLQELDAGHRFTPDGGRTHPFRGRGVRIPSLREVLRALPSTRLIIELKSEAVQEPLATLIQEEGAAHRVQVASGDRFRRRLRDTALLQSACSAELWRFFLAQLVGMAGRVRCEVDALQMPDRHRFLRPVSRRLVRAAHARNLPVHVWTVNDPREMRRFLDLGVDGLITDRPDLLARVLHEERGRALPPGLRQGAPE